MEEDDDCMVLPEEDERMFARLDEDFDFSMALMLQEQINEDENKVSKASEPDKRPMSVVDPQWETLDPNPDIHQLFLQFNKEFFWGVLEGIEVRWSTRMTLCAGICSYERRVGLCSVRLSQPLLKFRPRSDLVETLLHEMIHAYLFVTQNNKDHDAHGPEFLKHMSRLNKLTGAKISVYHTFHDEVDYQRMYWWKCNGPCQHRKPFYGILKRAMNRAPSPRDCWWAGHQAACGGQYIKIKEPENKKKKPTPDQSKAISEALEKVNAKDIMSFLSDRKNSSQSTSPGKINSKAYPKKIDSIISSANMGSRVTNIDSMEDNKSNTFVPFSGKGHVLGGGSDASATAAADTFLKMLVEGNKTDLKNETSSRTATGTSGSRGSVRGTTGGFRTHNDGMSSHSKFKSGAATGMSTASSSKTIVLNKTPKAKQTELNKSLQNQAASSPALPKSSNVAGKQKTLADFLQKKGKAKSPVLSRDISPKRKAIVVFSDSDEADEIIPVKASKKPNNNDRERSSHDVVPCPVCGLSMKEQEINSHLDACLNQG